MERLYDPNFQDAIAEIIRIVNPLVDSRALIRTLFSEHDFQILEYTGAEITKIKKISTGEIFTKGESFYHKKYKNIIKHLYFDNSLIGENIGRNYYTSYVRGSGGMYNLHEMISIERYKEMKEKGEL